MPPIMQRPHVPTALLVVSIVVVMFLVYHVTLGRRGRR